MSAGGFSILPWDTDFFGFRVARIDPGPLDERALRQVLAALAADKVKLAYRIHDAGDHASEAAAEACGGFPADLRLTYVADVLLPGGREAWPVVPARGEHGETGLQAFQDLAVAAGGHSRFHADPSFPRDRFLALYREWMRKSFTGEMADAVLVAEAGPGSRGNHAAGVITVSARAGVGNIGLLAVQAGLRGSGIGTALIRAAAEWFLERGCLHAEVVTQGANLDACRLYQANGYRVAKREQVRHFWLE